ncbi:MAG: adenosine deaminase [Candidatus Marinimicrobia bacterium]|jgi:adenosine deaminase|nr:adenosine deaminase [Candidatus Neomarinimicrobiota bacterium]MBT3502501.1 adenosine deaminase [Candidatus Neomarinimicrobiota bacterium]MBT3839202.1 adenosine deaminase [Candidatus Neomarinimicrobiota bacterium]MBT4000441.1 adenosine deaminase [Candidatus Neomarinimicrobiota bacterium]MBT4282791.1 adenosine deaminase [Candidatus Neomarinimicrobiota bacterium]
MNPIQLESFIKGIPKAELHLHIEGTFEPELMFEIARRNQISIPYQSVEELKKAYNFNNLQEFLDIYYAGASVLLHEQDFYDLTWAYLIKVQEQNLIHTEIFFDPQTHTDRGVSFDTVIQGIHTALEDGHKKLGISSRIIMCFLRHLDESAAFETLEQALPYKKWIIGVGLDSSEMGHPPSKFERVFSKAIANGFISVAHAGEEGPAEYVWEAINLLKVSRIDHGNRSIDDKQLIKHIAEKQIPLTVCPLSNLELKVVDDLKDHPLLQLMDSGLMVTLNSDDPAYFGGYMNENYIEIASALNLSKKQITELAKNSFISSFLLDDEKEQMIQKVETFYQNN